MGRVSRAFPISGDVLGRGVAMSYLSIVALIPLAAVVLKSVDGGLDTFWSAVTTEQAVASLKITLVTSLIVVLVNA
ncbi:MAG: sulfate/thiosulfate transport system permease protein, partial [Thermoleophilaceae bacterium]|nr:sulfate/thiosulfate transport system permease protein [Thermoleophilaceae bacterium]